MTQPDVKKPTWFYECNDCAYSWESEEQLTDDWYMCPRCGVHDLIEQEEEE